MTRYRILKSYNTFGVFIPAKTISEETTEDQTLVYFSHNNVTLPIHKKDIANNPDWFELIKEEPKEWEIISYNHRKTGGVSLIPSMHKDDPTIIHSVKRISDNEVFTVGDWCYNPRNGKNKRIVSFYINEGGGMFLNFKEGETLGLNITVATKTKEVFTWDDEKVLAFARSTNSESTTFQGRYADLKEFKTKQSKRLFLPKERKYDPEYTFFRFTQQDLDKAREQTWEAAREIEIIKEVDTKCEYCGENVDETPLCKGDGNGNKRTHALGGVVDYYEKQKYPTLESYINHISKTTKE